MEERRQERRRSYSAASGEISDLGSFNSDAEAEERGGAFSPCRASSSTPLRPKFSFSLIRDEKDEVEWDDEPIGEKDEVAWDDKPLDMSVMEIEMMKERFAKLLLGEDMSGGGKGVCTALAISNAITNLSASVFGAQWKLEPLVPQKKALWFREMEWLLSIGDSVVEFVPKIQQFPGGGTYEIMATRQRSDLYINLAALKKLDAMLISILDEFEDTEFWYADGGVGVDEEDRFSSERYCERASVRQEGKWWLPWPKVPEKGLSKDSRKMLQQCRDCGNQILKAALAINSNALFEMDIPTAYLESLPMNGRDCLGNTIYESLTADRFEPESLIDSLDLSSEHQVLDIANKIEAAAHVWKLKERKKHLDTQKSKRKAWSSKVKSLGSDGDKNQYLADRAETLLQYLRQRFPALPQTALDMSKIQYNKDVGHAILESYSRVMESLAFNIIARIDDVLCVDDAIKRSAASEPVPKPGLKRGEGFNGLPIQKKISPSPFSIYTPPYTSPLSSPPLMSSPTPVKSPSRGHKPDSVVPLPADMDRVWSRRLSFH
ncbi:rop guanine nucleotide exchange factor 1-like [Andrographis paniculata]|uniref:rop guanine nucleotide exchange factor 1-like n=1 Tax=Andrographis paniculata TaxID=175694 RepID=UPI0021E755BD|nr:rop guanine nucleotide exchange factor 1-like [Andrographis paniculata]XP_051131649.1 rop guanine nucleotide exchange factor 1-like [Andrographis paniculata]